MRAQSSPLYTVYHLANEQACAVSCLCTCAGVSSLLYHHFRWWSLRHAVKVGAIPDTLLQTPFRDPAWYSYLLRFYSQTRDLAQAYRGAMDKLLSEFVEEIGPLKAALDSDNPQPVLQLRELAMKGCKEDPQSWLPLELYQFYLEPYISRGSDTLWRLAPTSMYSYILSYAINSDGTIRDDLLARSRTLSDGMAFYPVVQYLAEAYNRYDAARIAGEAAVKSNTSPPIVGAADKLLHILVQRADEAGWLRESDVYSNSQFCHVLDHGANARGAADNTKKRMVKKCSREELLYLYWRMLRNIWAHNNTKENFDGNYVNMWELSQNLPDFLPQAVVDMKAASSASKL